MCIRDSGRVEEIIENAKDLSGEELTNYLTRENQKTVAHTKKDSEELMGQMLSLIHILLLR